MKLTIDEITELRDIIATVAVWSDWCDGMTRLQLRGLVDEISGVLENHYLRKEDE